MSKVIHGSRMFSDVNGVIRSVGEIWSDRAGNECFFRGNGSISCQTVNNEPSLTIQSEKDACDVNLIYAKYSKTGLMSNMRRDPPMYGDFSDVSDYHDAVLKVQKADESFMTLPAAVRARFSNDPASLIDFLSDPNNREEAINLGLIDRPKADLAADPVVSTPSAEGV